MCCARRAQLLTTIDNYADATIVDNCRQQGCMLITTIDSVSALKPLLGEVLTSLMDAETWLPSTTSRMKRKEQGTPFSIE